MKLISSRPYGANPKALVTRVGAAEASVSIGKDLLLVGAGAAIGYFGFPVAGVRTWQRGAIGGAIGLGAAILTG